MENITSRRNPICVHIKRLGENRSYRYEHGEFLCDGLKLLEEAVRSGMEVATLLTAGHIPFPIDVDTRVYIADRGLIDSLSPLKNAQDTLFTCKMPTTDGAMTTGGTHILLDSVQDPGNVGAILRTANAFGIKTGMLTGDCVDPYNPKVVRASMGAIFKQKMHQMGVDGLSGIKGGAVKLIAAVPDGDCRSVVDADLTDCIIAIGNEGRGLSEQVLALCDERVTIPVATDCDSLNAAAAATIMMWEAARRTRPAPDR